MNYKNLLYMTILSYISMFILMYVMVNNLTNVYPNLNQVYMAALMTIPMVIIELFLMGPMYPNKKMNRFIVITSLALFVVVLFCIRRQVAITDKEFLKSMIPHHAAALLMCRQASLRDPEIKQLCENIAKGQQAEINFMKVKLESIG